MGRCHQRSHDANLSGPRDELGCVVADEQNERQWMVRDDRPGRRYSVDRCKSQPDDDEIRLQFDDVFEGLATVLRQPDDTMAKALQLILEARGRPRLVLDEKDPKTL